jgi:glutamine amidotransferase
VSLLDYGAGNARSVAHALQHLGSEVHVAATAAELDPGEPVVVPGVGSFARAMGRLRAVQFDHWFDEHVRNGTTPYLGICLGLQILAAESDEAPGVHGLGLIEARVASLAEFDVPRVPRMGFDEVHFAADSPMDRFEGRPTDFYFCHGYALAASAQYVDAVSGPNRSIGVAVRREHVWATQFHLEKSQANGLAVIDMFLTTFGGR